MAPEAGAPGAALVAKWCSADRVLPVTGSFIASTCFNEGIQLTAALSTFVMHMLTLPQHNNTTPDDIGICEAYLAFLRAGGDNGAYWRVLDSHGEPMPAPHCHAVMTN